MAPEKRLSQKLFKQIIGSMKVHLEKNEFGILREWQIVRDANQFVLIFQDNPENWSVRWSIAQTLELLQYVKLVCQVGAFTRLDEQMALLRTIPDEDIRDQTAFYFLRKLISVRLRVE